MKDNGNEFRPVLFESHISQTNSVSITPVPVLLDKENKEADVGAKHLRDIISPIPFQSRKYEATTPCVIPVPASNREANKPEVEGEQIPATGFDKEKVSSHSRVENSVKEYDRPDNFRKDCLSPIQFDRNLSNANATALTTSPAMNQEIKESEIGVVKLVSSPEIGVKQQGALPFSVEVEETKGCDTSVTLRNLNSPIPFLGHRTATKTSCQKVNNQEVDGVIDTLPSIEDIIGKIPPDQKTELGLKLFNNLPENVVEGAVAQKLSTMPSKQLGLMFNRLPEEVKHFCMLIFCLNKNVLVCKQTDPQHVPESLR